MNIYVMIHVIQRGPLKSSKERAAIEAQSKELVLIKKIDLSKVCLHYNSNLFSLFILVQHNYTN